MTNIELVDKLKENRILAREEFIQLLTTLSGLDEEYLYQEARKVREEIYGKEVFLRGLIEFSNICKNDCRYCGIRKSNKNAERYRLTKEEIFQCADTGYELGFRTIVLQSGEDMYFTDDNICDIVKGIKNKHPDVAVTLSIGEKSRESYQAYFDAGADRYLLRHETANKYHYALLHPEGLSLENRMRCLRDLKDIGYQVGCGIMVGSPGQKVEHIVEDLFYMAEFNPEMVGIGPFIPHKDTPFKDEKRGTLEDTVHLLAIIRLMLPNVLLPATTALGTIDPLGREKGVLAGANVIMPNLSPTSVREKYLLYDGKICTGSEAAENHRDIEERMRKIGYKTVISRGDYKANN